MDPVFDPDFLLLVDMRVFSGISYRKKTVNSYSSGAPTTRLTCLGSSPTGILKAQDNPSAVAASKMFSTAAHAEAK